MEDKYLLILDFVSEGRLSVEEAVVLIEAIADTPEQEIWVVPYPVRPAESICLN